MILMIKQVKAARVPTLMVKPVSIRLYNDSRVLYHEDVALCCTMTIMTTLTNMTLIQICDVRAVSYSYDAFMMIKQ